MDFPELSRPTTRTLTSLRRRDKRFMRRSTNPILNWVGQMGRARWATLGLQNDPWNSGKTFKHSYAVLAESYPTGGKVDTWRKLLAVTPSRCPVTDFTTKGENVCLVFVSFWLKSGMYGTDYPEYK